MDIRGVPPAVQELVSSVDWNQGSQVRLCMSALIAVEDQLRYRRARLRIPSNRKGPAVRYSPTDVSLTAGRMPDFLTGNGSTAYLFAERLDANGAEVIPTSDDEESDSMMDDLHSVNEQESEASSTVEYSYLGYHN
jgi:hypothetical protein